MFDSFTAVKSSRRLMSLPEIAESHSLNNRTPSIATLTSYASSLLFQYPEQYDLVNDIANAGLGIGNNQNVAQLQEQLIDLERYLIDTK